VMNGSESHADISPVQSNDRVRATIADQEDYWDVSSQGTDGDPVVVLRQYRLDAVEAARLARDARDTAIRNGFGRHIMPFRPGEPGYTGEPSSGFRY
jgi:hypothetical protein